MAKASTIFTVAPEEKLMGWMKSACHLESTRITAQSKWRLPFPREFSQRDIKMVYDPASVFRPQSFHQFLLIAMEENCFGASLLGRYLGVTFKGTATKHSVIKHHWPRRFLCFALHENIGRWWSMPMLWLKAIRVEGCQSLPSHGNPYIQVYPSHPAEKKQAPVFLAVLNKRKLFLAASFHCTIWRKAPHSNKRQKGRKRGKKEQTQSRKWLFLLPLSGSRPAWATHMWHSSSTKAPSQRQKPGCLAAPSSPGPRSPFNLGWAAKKLLWTPVHTFLCHGNMRCLCRVRAPVPSASALQSPRFPGRLSPRLAHPPAIGLYRLFPVHTPSSHSTQHAEIAPNASHSCREEIKRERGQAGSVPWHTQLPFSSDPGTVCGVSFFSRSLPRHWFLNPCFSLTVRPHEP